MDVFNIGSEKKFVPWYNKAEWVDVMEKTYSNDQLLQKEAYEKMLVWKERSPKLPVGVECTMELLQILLFKRKCDDMPFSKKDLQLMYSTIILRFVNQVTHLFKNKLNKIVTCYEIAKMCNIPDWIVNIRHDAAHKDSLPSVELLNTAANFVLEWLYNNYWLVEAKEAQNFIMDGPPLVSDIERRIKILFNLWQATKLYNYAGCSTVGKIPNTSLRKHLHSLLSEKNILNEETDIEKNNDICLLDTYLINDGTSESSSVKIPLILKFLLKYLNKLLPARNDEFSKQILIKCLINCELFLPVINNHENYLNENEISGSLLILWRDVLQLYHSSYLISDLLLELSDISVTSDVYVRQLVAACWIRHIADSLSQPSDRINVNKSFNEGKKLSFSFLKNYEILQEDLGIGKSQTENYSFRSNLSKDVTLNFQILENIVQKSLINPNQCTLLYLNSLLELLNPPLDPSAKDRIIKLVETYTDTKLVEPKSDIIYTLDMISGSNVVEASFNEDHSEEIEKCSNSHPQSIWSKKYGVYDWSSCSFGCLPAENSLQ